jgi:DNA-binding MarR family transcriptional regulator
MKKTSLLERIHSAHRWLQALESSRRDYGTGDLLYSADVHTIVAVSQHHGCNLTELAEALGVSKPAAFKFVRKLTQLGYLVKAPAPQSGREVELRLTPKGESAVTAHRDFEKRTFGPLRAVEARLSAQDHAVVTRFLADLQHVIDRM